MQRWTRMPAGGHFAAMDRALTAGEIQSIVTAGSAGKCKVPPCGDVNGDGVVNIADALVVAQFDVGLRECRIPPFSHPEVCDVNRDGACNIGDALRMAQCDVGLISCVFTCRPFPCP